MPIGLGSLYRQCRVG